jgi:hypothetical protein
MVETHMVRRHWPFGVLVAAGLALRVAATIAYQPALVYIDTVRYLGGDERGLDPLGYTFLLLRPVLLLRGGLAGVAVVQHALGLAMGVCVYALLTRHGTPRWLAAIAAAPVLLDAYQVQAEQMIMPDVLFEALLVAALAILLWPAALSTRRLAVAAVVLGVSATVRQVGELLILPLLAYALATAAASGPRPSRWRVRAVRGAVALGVFALPVVGYMALSATALGTGFRLSDMDDAYLYARVAHAADCATLRVPRYEKPLCPPAGLGVDALATEANSPLYLYKPPPGVTRGTAVSGFDTAVITQQPQRVAASVAEDAVKLFALTRDSAPGDPPISRWQFQTTYPIYRVADGAVLGRSVPRTIGPLASALRWYQLHGGFTPGPLLLVFLLLGTGRAVSSASRSSSRRLACLLVTGMAATALLGADLYEFSWRYQLPALVTLPVAGALGAPALRRGAVTWRSGSPGTMIRCTLNRLTTLTPRSGRSPAASSTPIPGSGSVRMTSSGKMAPGAHTQSSSGTTSP